MRPVFFLPDAVQVFLSGIIRTGSHAADHRPDRAIRLTPYTTRTDSERSRNRRRPCECRTEGPAIVTRSVNRVALDE